ncbi:MAG: T9SS type A sorting domain-containing protein [Ignavibacteria bacterium]|nr:T9SS type A sorting domain-containing protein [Ignavibacteria bacterium]
MNTILLLAFLLIAGSQLFAQNVMISNKDFPHEPSIMISPKHPGTIIAGSNIDNYHISTDTGRTWTSKKLTSSYGVWGDPIIAVDTTGSFYFFHLSNPPKGIWIDRIVCQKTTDNGSSWNDGTFMGRNGTKAQDKESCAIDIRNNNLYLTWTQFDKYGSKSTADSSTILFSKSTDGGESWSNPLRLNSIAGDCIDNDNTVEGATPACGPNGELYVSWAGPLGLVFNKSLDQGQSWLPQEKIVDPFPDGWYYDIPGIQRANGLPFTVCDVSQSPYRGTIYINWSDQRNGVENTDIWIIKSTDHGDTWSAPIKVNDDASNRHQFFTSMTIDQTTGHLYCLFYDRRNYSGDSTDVYLAISIDGGNTWANRKVSQSPFVPNPDVFFGDYTGITAHDGIVRPIWTRLHFGAMSIWTDLRHHNDYITSSVPLSEFPESFSFENYPNPSDEFVFVSFKLRSQATVNLKVYDVHGNIVSSIISNESRSYGKYVEKINVKKLNIPSGMYMLSLSIDGEVKTAKQFFIK